MGGAQTSSGPDPDGARRPGGARYDATAVRACYPALGDGWAYLDGAAGTQLPQAVIAAESAAYAAGLGNHGGYFAAALRSAAHTRAARAAVADLVAAPDPDGVALGPSMTALTYRFAQGLARNWRAGDEVVVTRLDHDANVRPWVQAAARAGALVRWADPERPSCELPAGAVAALIGPRTRLVAVTAASNVVGTRPDVRAIAEAAHAVGALVYIDGVHATPHGPVDMRALGADLYATSAYKWSGPHLAAVAGDPGLLAGIHPDKLACSPEEVPQRFERGTSPFAQHAGLAAAVDHLAGLAAVAGGAGAGRGAGAAGPAGPGGGTGEGSRRARLVASMEAVQRHESGLLERLLAGIAGMGHVQRIGFPARQAPTVWFRVHGMHPDEVARRCADARVNVWSGHNYAWELAGLLGIRDSGSAVRASLSCYSIAEDVDRLLEVLGGLA